MRNAGLQTSSSERIIWIMELSTSKTDEEKVVVSVDTPDELVNLIYNSPFYRLPRPRTLGVDLEFLGLRSPEYPRQMSFKRKELAQIAGKALLSSDLEDLKLARQIVDYFHDTELNRREALGRTMVDEYIATRHTGQPDQDL